MNDNGEGKIKKKCPFLGEWCIEDACSLFIEVIQQQVNTLGVRTASKSGMCAFNALPMIMSNKPTSPPQTVKIPPLMRG